jgi:hypothetical protein
MSRSRGNFEDEEVGLLGHHQEDVDRVKHFAEPASHVKNRKKGCKQMICPCMAAPPDGFELTQDESDAFGRLENKMKVLYDRTSTKHEGKLKTLYEEFVLPATPPAQDSSLKTKAWGVLGFQGEDPRTDFRGGGYMSLVMILNFCRQNGDILVRFKAETERGTILFACSSINTTFFLKNFFHMGDPNAIPEDKKHSDLASRVSFKSFCTWVNKEEKVIERLHDLILTRLFELWTAACTRNPTLTIMDMGSAEKIVREDFKSTINSRMFESLQAFEELVRSHRLDPAKVTKFTF